MKKFLPLIVFAALFLGLAGTYWISASNGPDLRRFVKGEVAKFQVFDTAKELPPTPFYSREGEAVRFVDFKGKTLLVNLWATWCEPCKEEMPALQNLQNALGDETFQIFTISVDWKGFEVMDPFFAEYGITNLEAFWDNSGHLPNELDNKGLPLTILISPNGKWLGRVDGPLAWDSEDAIALIKAAKAPE